MRLIASLVNEGGRVQPMAWQAAGAAPQGGRQRPAEPAASPQEMAALRARLAEVESVSERQSREAFQAGLEKGRQAVRAEAAAEVAAAVERLAQAMTEIAQIRAQLLERTESDLVKLAIEIARRILHREMTVDPAALEALVGVALEKLQSQQIYRVRVHPDQEPMVRACLQKLGNGSPVEIVADAGQERGGVVFESSRGNLDASLETQLAEIERGLIDRLRKRP
jgi:flagellar assembly protein FliH